MSEPPKKIEKLEHFVSNSMYQEALAMCARFPKLKSRENRKKICRAHECLTGNADFHRQLGKDPLSLIVGGIEAIFDEYRPTFEKRGIEQPNSIQELVAERYSDI